MIPMLAMLALSVDLGQIAYAKARLQAAADSAALAAILSYGGDPSVDASQVGLNYVDLNAVTFFDDQDEGEREVDFGVWDPDAQSFTTGQFQPNAVRVVLRHTTPLSFAKVLGHDTALIETEAIAVGAVQNNTTWKSVYVTSTKDLSNVVLAFDDGVHQKFEGLSGYSGTFEGTGANAGKEIVTAWVKSGPNASGDGPGYGERFDNPGHGDTIHGAPASGPKPHCTATFESTGAEFSDSGFGSPYRLVR